MAERAIHIEGIDEGTRQHVRIHLQIVTSEEPATAAIPFSASRGFLPEAAGTRVAGRRAAAVSTRQAQVFGSAHSLRSPDAHRVFTAPRGFLPEF